MDKSQSADWKRREDAAAEQAPEPVTELEPEPASVTPQESAYRTRDATNQRRMAKRAERRAA